MSASDSASAGTSGRAGGDSGSDFQSRRDHPDDIFDSCLEFMGSYVTKSLRVKYDKWQKLVTAEESKVISSIKLTTKKIIVFINFNVLTLTSNLYLSSPAVDGYAMDRKSEQADALHHIESLRGAGCPRWSRQGLSVQELLLYPQDDPVALL